MISGGRGPSATDLTASLVERPIVIIGCNRSGTTLVFRNLSEHPVTWSLYEESQHIFYRHYPIDPQLGDRLAESPAPEVARAIIGAFFEQAHNREILCDRRLLGWVPRKLVQRSLNRLYKRPPLRLVEKTPANCLRVPFLAGLFPDARFILLVRRAEDVISSLMEGWKIWSNTGRGPWVYGKWHYLVPPGWRDWIGKSLAEICAFQWIESNRIALRDLDRYCMSRYLLVRHEDAMARPAEVYRELLDFCELPPSRFFDRQVGQSAGRVFTHRGSSPRPHKWKDLHYREIEGVRPMFHDLMAQLYPGA